VLLLPNLELPGQLMVLHSIDKGIVCYIYTR